MSSLLEGILGAENGMSKASEDKFDEFQKLAISEQKVILYFCAILPSGEALQVTSSLLPEVLEEIGPFPFLGEQRPRFKDAAKMEARGKRIAQLMNATINPMAQTLIQAIAEKHHADNTKASLDRGHNLRARKEDPGT